MAVDYNETSKAASIVFRGSSSTVDWVQDFKLWCGHAQTYLTNSSAAHDCLSDCLM